jgi:hypothetical protein
MNNIITLSRAISATTSDWVGGFLDRSEPHRRAFDQLELDKIAQLVAAGWPTERARTFVQARFAWARATNGYTGDPAHSPLRSLGTPDFRESIQPPWLRNIPF